MSNRAFGLVVVLTAGASLIAACSSSPSESTVVTANGLATSCGVDDDCVGVFFGDVCGFCATDIPNAAIASSSEAAYQSALNAAGSHCPPSRAAGSCVAPLTITTCTMGTCALTTCSGAPASAHACAPTNDAGSTVVAGGGFATSCTADTDCVGAFFGDICGLCATAIPNAAIASSAEAAYQSAVNAAGSHCPPSRVAGSCVIDSSITTCTMGTCALTTCSGPPAGAHACASTGDSGTSDAP